MSLPNPPSSDISQLENKPSAVVGGPSDRTNQKGNSSSEEDDVDEGLDDEFEEVEDEEEEVDGDVPYER